MLPIVAIIGRVNVGKSTLFNRLIGKREAITADWAGTTRDRLYSSCQWNGKEFLIVDTAGLEAQWEEEDLTLDIQRQINIAIEESSLLLFMVDVKTGLTEQDQRAIKKIRFTKKPFLLIANKCDHLKDNCFVNEFYKLGVKEIISISALNGKGTGDLLDAISQRIKKSRTQKQLQTESQTINVAIVGRPNVGKSSLLNKLIGQKRTVVSKKAGTTRDTARFLTTVDNKKINFIDTAGIRRRGKVGQTDEGIKPGQIEKYSVLRAMRAIETSEVVLLLIDATEGITSQDLHIAGFALEKKKSIIIIVNKWDMVENDQTPKYRRYLGSNINFLPFAPVIFLSAKTGQNVSGLFDLVLQAYQARFKRIKTAELNAKLSQDILKKPPVAQKNILPNIKYITQAEVNPPTFVFFTNHPQSIHFSYIRFLENRIREHWDFFGTPISILFKKKSD